MGSGHIYSDSDRRPGDAAAADIRALPTPGEPSAGGEKRVELAVRDSDGLTVTLLWDPPTNLLAVVLVDSKGSGSFELVLDPDERPLDAFYHPYAAAAARGVALADAA
jgi:hypothetical protein